MDVDSPGGGWKPALPRPAPRPPGPRRPVYRGGLTEAQLAAYQQRQGDYRNDFADYSVAAVLDLLQGGAVGADAGTQVPTATPAPVATPPAPTGTPAPPAANPGR